MARRRLAVALLAPPAEAAAIDVLRQAAGVAEPFSVAPHLTLVPPVNVPEADLPAVEATLRRVAAAARPVSLTVGPAATFLPETPTLHLAVGGPDLDALRSLRGHLRAGPFDRPDVWPFHPHVTICEHASVELIQAGLVAFAGLRRRWQIDSLHLLEQHRHGPDHPQHGRAHWVPIREEPLGGAVVVGRGGVELSLRTVGCVEPTVAALVGIDPLPPPIRPDPPRPLVVVAEADDGCHGLIGAAVGHTDAGAVAALDHLVVVQPNRRLGVGRQLVSAWCSAAARRGAELVVATDRFGDAAASLGFVATSGVLLRRL